MEAKIQLGEEATLDNLKIGMSGTITRIAGEGRIKRRLFDMGLTPGAEVYLRKKAPLGDPLEITIRGYELSLRKNEAQYAYIKVTDLGE
ncbi:MAG: ferrous iron transport protein A [Bacilli bacterium]|nr:ferrous iron transport protein A [Bacilli bacterium]